MRLAGIEQHHREKTYPMVVKDDDPVCCDQVYSTTNQWDVSIFDVKTLQRNENLPNSSSFDRQQEGLDASKLFVK